MVLSSSTQSPPLRTDASVGIIGASSFIGQVLIEQLLEQGYRVSAFTRKLLKPATATAGVQWRTLDAHQAPTEAIDLWICVAPIKVLPDYLPLLERYGAQRVVALSSTSLFTKAHSPDQQERDYVAQLAQSEAALRQWSEQKQVGWTVIRPTLVYGRGLDRNVSTIARFITRFGFFPLFGRAQGLRQPVHVQDVAAVCLTCIERHLPANEAFNISGAEIVSYRDMVWRIFGALGKKPRCVRVPLWAFSLAVRVIRQIPRYHDFSSAMAQRMNEDMIFNSDEAQKTLGFSPRRFAPKKSDLLHTASEQ